MERKKSKYEKYKLGRIDLSGLTGDGRNGVVNLLAGMGAGPTSDFALFPLDSMKTRLQASKGSVKVAKNSKLFLGFGIAMVGSSLTYGAHWMIYEWFKRHLVPLTNGNEALVPFVYMGSAAMAQLLSSGIRSPFEVIKQHLQVGIFFNTKYAIKSIYRSGGIGAFYAGYVGLLYKNIPYDAIEMTLYEMFRKGYMKARGIKSMDDMSLWENMGVGFLSSGIASFITTPMDVVKTRMMLSASERGQQKLSVMQMFSKVYREEGFRALFSGAVTRVVLVSTAGAVYFGAFEAYRKKMRDAWME